VQKLVEVLVDLNQLVASGYLAGDAAYVRTIEPALGRQGGRRSGSLAGRYAWLT
jgi:hypothetical protein